MIIKREPFGFIIEIRRQGKATVILTFEEVPSRRSTKRKHYYCVVDVGFYERQPNGRIGFTSLGDFVIEDWGNQRLYIKKRNKLRSLLGVTIYNDLVYKVNRLVEGEVVENGYFSRVKQYG